MNIIIFNDLTTDEYLKELEAEAKKYDGLHVEMDVPEQRKYVKDKAALIEGVRKKVERARIDKSRDFKVLVEDEAKRIDERLVNANRPFILLIDEYKEKRAIVLAKKKAKEDAEELRIQIIADHETALSMAKLRDFEIQEKIREQKERDQKIADDAKAEAEARAKQAELDRIQAEKDAELARETAKQAAVKYEEGRIATKKADEERAAQTKIDSDKAIIAAREKAKADEIERQKRKEEELFAAKAKLEADKKHVGEIRKAAKIDLMKISGVNETIAKAVVLAISNKKVSNILIGY